MLIMYAFLSVFGKGNVSEAEPLMAGEDFSFYCLKVGG
jgi:hypothetical protein